MINGIGSAYSNYAPTQGARSSNRAANQQTYTPLPTDDAPAAPAPNNTAATAAGHPMPVRRIDVIGWGAPRLPPANCDDLEFNAYRPDAAAVDGSSNPFRLISTGELLTPAVSARVKQQVDQVALDRIGVYNKEKAAGKSNDEIKKALQDYDAALPDAYKQLVGWGSKFDPTVRYDQHRPKYIDDKMNAMS